MPGLPITSRSRSTSSFCSRCCASGAHGPGSNRLRKRRKSFRWRQRSKKMTGPVGGIPVQALRESELAEPVDVDRPRVLLVDDDERNLLAVQSILEDVGEIVAARSGEE